MMYDIYKKGWQQQKGSCLCLLKELELNFPKYNTVWQLGMQCQEKF